MAGHSHLLVPVTLQALVVNRNDRTNTLWSVSRREFDGPQFKAPVEPFPFVRGNDRPRIGVTLHWSLPDAITRGRRDGDGKLLFPLIPNRWLVVRNPTRGARVVQVPAAWVIESDFLGAAGSNLYPGVDQLTVTRLGQSCSLTAPYDDTSGAPAPFLTATGGYAASAGGPIPGDDPAFAASVGGIDNVLSFYDSLADLKLFNDPANPKKDDPAGFSSF
ncbi:MAG: hypothetical protein NTW28_26395, partial [Candidatus Solibacter sp.]|nr:hypothetical protein [Candidatus Solibacter sp.]